MTQAVQPQSLPQSGGTVTASTQALDDPEPESDIPLNCSLQWDALQAQGDVVDAAIAELQARMGALADCILGSGKKADPFPPPAPGGEYVSASSAAANPVSAVSYRQRQIDESIAAISAERRRLKDLLRTP
jgi:hypothetical protein